MGKIQFTCEHCGEVVRRGEGEPPRNHCPACLWSKHVEIGGRETGNVGYPPCGAMMRGTDVGGEQVVWRCVGCGFMMRGPTDDYLFRTVNRALGSTGHLTLYPRETPPGYTLPELARGDHASAPCRWSHRASASSGRRSSPSTVRSIGSSPGTTQTMAITETPSRISRRTS